MPTPEEIRRPDPYIHTLAKLVLDEDARPGCDDKSGRVYLRNALEKILEYTKLKAESA